ncbi:helix-turn-helix domain-containing protein [Microbacterium sp. X-17]|uniref:helix-turn-helix transcriptional regulator n=1 Tax=Microbacterium sp. X-17 TaxID=3144404 RepID=UPI0031F490A0
MHRTGYRPLPFYTFAVARPDRSSYGRPLLISQDEAAHRLGVSRTTIWRLIAAGDLQPVRIGSRTLVSNLSIDEYIARQIDDGGRR